MKKGMIRALHYTFALYEIIKASQSSTNTDDRRYFNKENDDLLELEKKYELMQNTIDGFEIRIIELNREISNIREMISVKVIKQTHVQYDCSEETSDLNKPLLKNMPEDTNENKYKKLLRKLENKHETLEYLKKELEELKAEFILVQKRYFTAKQKEANKKEINME